MVQDVKKKYNEHVSKTKKDKVNRFIVQNYDTTRGWMLARDLKTSKKSAQTSKHGATFDFRAADPPSPGSRNMGNGFGYNTISQDKQAALPYLTLPVSSKKKGEE